MKNSRSHEMRSFLIAASALVAVLIVLIVLVTTINSVKTLDQEQTKAKQKDVDSVINMAKGTAASLKEVEADPRMLQFISPEMIKSAASGENIKPFLDSTIFITRAVGSAEYAAFIINGRVYTVAPRIGIHHPRRTGGKARVLHRDLLAEQLSRPGLRPVQRFGAGPHQPDEGHR